MKLPLPSSLSFGKIKREGGDEGSVDPRQLMQRRSNREGTRQFSYDKGGKKRKEPAAASFRLEGKEKRGREGGVTTAEKRREIGWKD